MEQEEVAELWKEVAHRMENEVVNKRTGVRPTWVEEKVTEKRNTTKKRSIWR